MHEGDGGWREIQCLAQAVALAVLWRGPAKLGNDLSGIEIWPEVNHEIGTTVFGNGIA